MKEVFTLVVDMVEADVILFVTNAHAVDIGEHDTNQNTLKSIQTTKFFTRHDLAKYATSERQLSCSCGVHFAPREGHPIRLQMGADISNAPYEVEPVYQKGVCCPRCQSTWWMEEEYKDG
jgi:hypothetical protein